mgnify:CR=1 FL=1
MPQATPKQRIAEWKKKIKETQVQINKLNSQIEKLYREQDILLDKLDDLTATKAQQSWEKKEAK